MKCPICGIEIPKSLIEYKIYQPHKDEVVELVVCGKCLILTNLLQLVREIKDGES